MSRNGSGVYELPPTNPVVPDTVITTAWANGTMSDIAAALTQSISNDGQTTVIDDLPMSGYAHTGVGPATAFDQYTRADQTQRGSLILLVSVGFTAGPPDAYTATLPLGAITFTQGQMVTAQFNNANTGPATLNINLSGAKAIKNPDGSALSAGAILPGRFYTLCYDGTGWRFLSVVADTAYLDAHYLKLSGGTLTGRLTLGSDPVGGMDAANASWVMAQITSSVSGVASWNGRTGAVTLTSVDVTNALTFTPYSAANPAGYISGITGANVTTALGYTPANKAGDTFTGTVTAPNVVASTAMTSKGYKQTVYIANVNGSTALDFANGQSQVLTITAALTVSAVNNLAVGDLLRVVLNATNLGVSWPTSVKWSAGVAPDLAAGTLKIALVVLETAVAGTYLASAVVY